MSSTLRQISSSLAVVMFLTSVISAVLVMCTSGTDHHAFELLGHQEQIEDHSSHSLVFAESSIGHEPHPEICTDTPLLSDIPLQRDNLVSSCGEKVQQVFLLYPVDELTAAVPVFNSQSWPVWRYVSSMRPPTDDLSSIRLLI